ncbi:MAG: cupin domain-containing protein [Solirubrobacterales bacterium]
MANVFEPEFDDREERPGFTYQRARLGRHAGAQRLGTSLYEIPPGQATFPYHAHSANEEMLIVLRGRPHLRTPEGWREVEEGEVVAFPVGRHGAHQMANRSEDTVRLLVISEMNTPEVSIYPDSGKILAGTRAPGSPGGEDDIFAAFSLEDEVDYWEGEVEPEEER